MPTITQNFGSLTVGFLSFTNIADTETDFGVTTSFLGSGPFLLTDTDIFGLSGIDFAAFSAGVSGANSLQTNVFTYSVHSTSPTQLINSLDLAFQIDSLAGLLSADIFTATEQVFDPSGNLIAMQTISASNPVSVPFVFAQAFSNVNVRMTWTMNITAAGSAVSAISTSGLQMNFGTIAPSQLCSIGDIAFLDSAHTGLESGFDAGPGVANVAVELLDSTGTTVLASTTTGANGIYSFTNLVAGTYEVKFYAPVGYTLTTQGVGTNPGINSSANQLTGITAPITLTPGQANHNVEVGLVATGTGTLGQGGFGGLTPGFWAQHSTAWDGVAGSKYGNLVNSGVLSGTDVLYALPNHGASGPGGAVGVLLGDANGNGTSDMGSNALFVPLSAATQLINSSASANDTRQILLRHALAAQLNIDNGDRDPGLTTGATVGTDLISVAVAWLKGQGPFIYSDGSSGKVDFVGATGVLDSGISGTAIDYNTKTASFTSTQLTSNTNAWNQSVALGLSPTDFHISGEDLKNALQAFNQNQLITSRDGTTVGWNTGNGAMTDIHTNNAAGFWTVLKDAGVIHG
jgi:hypothetical protein